MRARFYRHVSEGGWPFSTAAHGWPISDCTAEGLKAVLLLRDQPCIKANCVRITEERLHKALNVLLTLQNVDGGWATYENNRGYSWCARPRPLHSPCHRAARPSARVVPIALTSSGTSGSTPRRFSATS